MLEQLKERFFDIRREEWPRALGLALFFFLVIAIFWVLKPIKTGLFLTYFAEHPVNVPLLGGQLTGAQAEQLAVVVNMFVAYGVVVAFSHLADAVSRRRLIVIFCTVFGALFLLYAAGVGEPSEPLVWALYVTGDIWTTAMVASFWAFANDITRADEAERLYGVVGLGGVVGGFVGARVVSQLVETVGRAPLLASLLVPLAGLVVLAYWIDARVRERRGTEVDECCPEDGEEAEESGVSAAFEGAKLVAASKYLLGIAAVLGLYEVVSNIGKFQLNTIVEQAVTGGPAARDAFFGRIGQITGLASIGIQLFGTTFVLRNFGVGVGLLILPAAMLMGSTGFLLLPTLFFGSFLQVSDNALNYSMNQSAKEALYTPTSQAAKYKAKAFIDMFVQRAAKVLAVGINLVLSAVVLIEVRWLSIASLVVIAAWVAVAVYLGREFRDRSGSEVPAKMAA